MASNLDEAISKAVDAIELDSFTPGEAYLHVLYCMELTDGEADALAVFIDYDNSQEQ